MSTKLFLVGFGCGFGLAIILIAALIAYILWVNHRYPDQMRERDYD